MRRWKRTDPPARTPPAQQPPAPLPPAPLPPAPLPQLPCPVCGATDWEHSPVLWPALIEEWQLDPVEAASVDRQQGTHCRQCSGSLRAAALARTILAATGYAGTLTDWVKTAPALSVLEINEAATLTPVLAQLPGHTIVRWPEVDMQALPYANATWDLIVHSDTLEHVPDPALALRECRRVLAPGGSLCFTTPVVPGRLTRRRDGLPASYHGLEADPIYLVVSEFGADAWTLLLDAGFDDVRLHPFGWPDALAFLARSGAAPA